MEEDIRCCGCFSPVTGDVQAHVQAEKMDAPWRCPHCGALLFVTRDVEGVARAARMALGVDDARVEMQMDVAGPGVHLVCAWDPGRLFNASEVARIVGVDLAFVSRLIHRKEFPNARREGRVWRIPLGDVHAYLLRRAVRGKEAEPKSGKEETL